MQGNTISLFAYPRFAGLQGGATGFHKAYQGSQAWWSVGEFMRPGLTHQSVGLTLTNDAHVEDTWDLSDSLADLFKEVNRRDRDVSSQSRTGGRGGGAGAGGGGGYSCTGMPAWTPNTSRINPFQTTRADLAWHLPTPELRRRLPVCLFHCLTSS